MSAGLSLTTAPRWAAKSSHSRPRRLESSTTQLGTSPSRAWTRVVLPLRVTPTTRTRSASPGAVRIWMLTAAGRSADGDDVLGPQREEEAGLAEVGVGQVEGVAVGVPRQRGDLLGQAGDVLMAVLALGDDDVDGQPGDVGGQHADRVALGLGQGDAARGEPLGLAHRSGWTGLPPSASEAARNSRSATSTAAWPQAS